MKKTYINPEMEIVKIQTTGMLATSTLPVDSTKTLDSGDILAPELSDLTDICSFVFE